MSFRTAVYNKGFPVSRLFLKYSNCMLARSSGPNWNTLFTVREKKLISSASHQFFSSVIGAPVRCSKCCCHKARWNFSARASAITCPPLPNFAAHRNNQLSVHKAPSPLKIPDINTDHGYQHHQDRCRRRILTILSQPIMWPSSPQQKYPQHWRTHDGGGAAADIGPQRRVQPVPKDPLRAAARLLMIKSSSPQRILSTKALAIAAEIRYDGDHQHGIAAAYLRNKPAISSRIPVCSSPPTTINRPIKNSRVL